MDPARSAPHPGPLRAGSGASGPQEGTDKALGALVESLREQKAARLWRIVFGGGTVVETEAGPEFKGFAAAGGKGDGPILQDNRLAWEALKRVPGEEGRAARRALAMLADDGYPHPGSADADREVHKKVGFWRVDWPYCSPRIYNILAAAHGDTEFSAAVAAADRRRADCISPRVFAAVAPDLAVTRL